VAAWLVVGVVAGCAPSHVAVPAAAPVPASTTTTASTLVVKPLAVEQATSTTGAEPELHYVFPFVGKKVSYRHRHHDYPATDVFGCGASVVAPVHGAIDQTRTVDEWKPKVDDPATRGGKYVSLLGDDGVRYYFAHLDSVAVQVGQQVAAGDLLGVMGQTGNARKTACHTHVGISWPCGHDEWAVRRGEIWPWKYLDAWQNEEQLSPAVEVAAAHAKNPDACDLAERADGASDA
jgi:murein DD-endopeptidase MepM/ murein hydrolase activator NlpD